MTQRTLSSDGWQAQWGTARDLLPEFPEDWFDASALKDQDPDWILETGEPGALALTQESLIRELGLALDDEIHARLTANGSRPPVRALVDDRLRHEIQRIDEALVSRFESVLNEAAVFLFGPHGPAQIAADDDARFKATQLAYEPDVLRGVNAAEVDLFLKQRATLHQRLVESEEKFWIAQHRWVAAYREEAKNLLAVCRDIGPGADTRALSMYPDPLPQLGDALDRVAEWVPRDWIEHINNHGPWTVVAADQAWSDPTNKAVGIAGSINRTGNSNLIGGAAHQITHLAQAALPHLNRASWVFLDRRTSIDGLLLPLRPLSDISPAFHDSLTFRDNGFAHPYVGRCQQYPAPTDTYQIIPVGLQSLTAGWPDMTMDPDHRQFLLGVLSAG